MDRYITKESKKPAADGPAAELSRIIGHLNSQYGLHLQRPGQPASSASGSGALENAIVERIKDLHRQAGPELSRAMGSFHVEAKNIPPNRTALLERLYRILLNPNRRHQTKRKHRQQQSNQTLDFHVQKPRPSKDTAASKSVDALPTSSRLPSAAPSSSKNLGREQDTRMLHPFPRSSTAAAVFNAFPPELPSTLPPTLPPTPPLAPSPAGRRKQDAKSRDPSTSRGLGHTAQEPTSSSRTQLNAGPSRASQERRHRRSESDHDDCFSNWEPSNAEYDSVVFDAESSFGQTTFAKQSGNTSNLHHSRTTVATSFATTHPGASRASLRQFPLTKLENIWPTPLPKGLRKAPLAIIWEVTRAALHCRVNLEDVNLKYEPNALWHEQANLRSTISTHPLFVGKRLPAPSDSIAWDTALKEFCDKSKAVSLCADLSYNESADGPLYNVRLQPLRLEVSHRLAHRFGADRFLDITLPSPSHSRELPSCAKGFEPSHLVQWLSEGSHEFLGRTWEPFFVREAKVKNTTSESPYKHRVSLFATNGHAFLTRRPSTIIPSAQEASMPAVRTAMKLRSLLGWALNLRDPKNRDQPIMKLFSRLSLSLSRCPPTVVLERSQILIREKDLGTHSVMNDGCGRMSRKLALSISSHLGMTDCPSGFQARLGSAKGMWIVDVNDERPDEEWIEIYPSQTKWVCDFNDPRHRTFEVRDWPKELKSASLYQQLIPVLEAQSVDPEALRTTMEKHAENTLQSDLEALKSAVQDPQAARLWLQSLAMGERSLDGSVECLGGLPDSTVDRVAFLLDCGFDPLKLKYLNELLWAMLTKKTDTLLSKMNITVPCSTYALMVVDFSDSLEEDEVALCFSTKFQTDDGFSDTLLEEMDILVARAPAHFPSDIQKVRAVSRPQLRRLKNTIVFSTKGKVSLADRLSGGDYDGDRAWICWDQDIVRDFRNAPPSPKFDLVKDGFLGKDRRKFSSLVRACNDLPSDEACREFIREAMSFNMRGSFLGICTKYKEKLCYMENSVASPAAIKISELLSNLVDQSKQGILFTDEDWKRFRLKCLKRPLDIEETAYNLRQPPRKRVPGSTHILDHLSMYLSNLITETRTECSDAIKHSKIDAYDQDLTELRRVYEDRPDAKQIGFNDVLQDLKTQLLEVKKLWTFGNSIDETDEFTPRVKQIYQAWMNIRPAPELLSTPFGREIMEDWGRDEIFSPWQLLKASVTFGDFAKVSYKFVWYMAAKQLGYIKARMQPCDAETTPVLMVPKMWGTLKPDKRMITTLAAQRKAAASEESSASALEEVFDFDDHGTVIDDVQ